MLPRLTRDWDGETVFIVAGGPSVKKVDLDRLRGHRVIVINSSFMSVPWADVLVFADLRWWRENGPRVRANFRGQVVTVSPSSELYSGLVVLQRQRSGGLASDPTRLVVWHTSVTTAVNVAVHRGAGRVCVLGLDGEGDWHHAPHPAQWGRNAGKFKYHAEALEGLVAPLAALGVEILNLNPESKHRMFPFATLESILQGELA